MPGAAHPADHAPVRRAVVEAGQVDAGGGGDPGRELLRQAADGLREGEGVDQRRRSSAVHDGARQGVKVGVIPSLGGPGQERLGVGGGEDGRLVDEHDGDVVAHLVAAPAGRAEEEPPSVPEPGSK